MSAGTPLLTFQRAGDRAAQEETVNAKDNTGRTGPPGSAAQKDFAGTQNYAGPYLPARGRLRAHRRAGGGLPGPPAVRTGRLTLTGSPPALPCAAQACSCARDGSPRPVGGAGVGSAEA